MKKLCYSLLILIISISASISALATPNCGAWAEDAINCAIECKILSNDLSRNYFAPIKRIEIATLLANAYKNSTGENIICESACFTDVTNPNVDVVSALSIMNGYGDGTFSPDAFTSRQEMAKIILMYQSAVTHTPLALPETFECTFTDFNDLSDWAKPYVEKASCDKLLNGYVDGSFGGTNTVSWQEAVVLVERVADFNLPPEKEPVLSEDFNLNIDKISNRLMISWDLIDSDKVHTLSITEQRISRYEGDIPPNQPITLDFYKETSYFFEANPNKMYTIEISCDDMFSKETICTDKLFFDDMTEIANSYPSTQEEAELLMTEITVPVWQISGKEKVASELTLKVHNTIAEKVILVFEEIFSGEEQFPIKDIGGYSWRGGTTEHNGGTAIDINSNENYCIYNDGTAVGSHWKPYEDPYSITPYGDVVRIFEKYGFTWGGDAWSNPKDYMHFSYLGT